MTGLAVLAGSSSPNHCSNTSSADQVEYILAALSSSSWGPGV
jgi:hypothetical protein